MASKPKLSVEQLRAVIFAVFSEADDDNSGELDMGECADFLKMLMHRTYPGMVWDNERFKQGFYAIDDDKNGFISFEELFEVIKQNAIRQGMINSDV